VAFKKAGFSFAGEYVNVLARVEFKTAREIAALATALYAKREVDSVYIIFSEFKSIMVPNLTVEKLLPVEAIPEERSSDKDKEETGTQVDYIYEQPEAQLLDKLLPRYIETQLLRAMLESSASEYAARMTAMESATKNAGDVIEGLTLHMNKVRQAAITKEIIEIVSGAAYGA
jgi:F-type H+-transporting ATPase subunit gamma